MPWVKKCLFVDSERVHPILCCCDPESSECITYVRTYVFSEPVLFRSVYLAIGAYNMMHTYAKSMSGNVVRCIRCRPSARSKAESSTEFTRVNLMQITV